LDFVVPYDVRLVGEATFYEGVNLDSPVKTLSPRREAPSGGDTEGAFTFIATIV
jgi:hypothetical protein